MVVKVDRIFPPHQGRLHKQILLFKYKSMRGTIWRTWSSLKADVTNKTWRLFFFFFFLQFLFLTESTSVASRVSLLSPQRKISKCAVPYIWHLLWFAKHADVHTTMCKYGEHQVCKSACTLLVLSCSKKLRAGLQSVQAAGERNNGSCAAHSSEWVPVVLLARCFACGQKQSNTLTSCFLLKSENKKCIRGLLEATKRYSSTQSLVYWVHCTGCRTFFPCNVSLLLLLLFFSPKGLKPLARWNRRPLGAIWSNSSALCFHYLCVYHLNHQSLLSPCVI